MVSADFGNKYKTITATPAYLHDYGQTLQLTGLTLPAVVEAHFSFAEYGESVLSIGSTENNVTIIPIPDLFLTENGNCFCYIFDRNDSSGKTIYKVIIPVKDRPALPTSAAEPSAEEMAYFEAVIAAVTEQAEAAAGAARTAVEAKLAELGISGARMVTITDADDGLVCDTDAEDIIELIESGTYVFAHVVDSIGGMDYYCPYTFADQGTVEFKWVGMSEGESGMSILMRRYYVVADPDNPVLTADVNYAVATKADVSAKADKCIVTISGGPTTYTADKTYAEVMQALANGAAVCAYISMINAFYPLESADGACIKFGYSAIAPSAVGISSGIMEFILADDDTVTINMDVKAVATQDDLDALAARVAALEGGNT